MGMIDRLFGRGETPAGYETRAPVAANQQTRFLGVGQAQVPEWDAEQAIRWGYIANTFVYRCVQVKARAVAGLPIRVTPVNAGRDPQAHDPNHPLARLLSPPPGGPNRQTSARQLVAWSVAQKLVTGRMAWELERPQGASGTEWVPVGFWPLPASHLKAIPTEGGSDLWARFVYGRPDNQRTLTTPQVFYHWRPGQSDFRQAESVLQAARFDVSVAVMQDRYDYAFLRNDARPAAIVVHEAFAESADRDAWRRQFEDRHQGPDNAGRVFFAESDTDVGGDTAKAIAIHTLGMSAHDAQMVERYAAKIRAITVAFGVPLTMLGDASERTFANAGEEREVFWEGVATDDLPDFEDAMNLQLSPRFGGTHEVWFDTSGVRALKSQAEPLTAKVGAPSMVQAQLMTIDEGRADYGLPPLPDGAGDRLMTAEEIVALRGNAGGDGEGRMPATFTSAPSPAINFGTFDFTGGGADAHSSGSASSSSDSPRGPITGPDRGRRETEPAGEHREPDSGPPLRELRAVGALTRLDRATEIEERAWTRALTRLFARQADTTVNRLQGKRGRQMLRDALETRQPEADDVFDRAFWTGETRDVVRDLIEHTWMIGADSIEIDFDIVAEGITELVEARANQLAGQVTDTTYDQIQKALVEGVTEGESVPKLAERIRAVFDQADDVRATRIARTEVLSAYNGGRAASAAAAPADVVAGLEWIATRDSRTRDTHSSVDGAVVSVGATFQVGTAALAYPGDPNGPAKEIVNCRCTVAALSPAEFAAATASRSVPLRVARTALRLVRPGEFDPYEFRTALLEAV